MRHQFAVASFYDYVRAPLSDAAAARGAGRGPPRSYARAETQTGVRSVCGDETLETRRPPTTGRSTYPFPPLLC